MFPTISPTIRFETEGEHQLQVYIDTHQNIEIRSITSEDLDNFTTLVTTKKNLKNYRNREIWEQEEIHRRHSEWLEGWKNNNPFSAFSILDTEAAEGEGYAGWAVLGGGGSPGQSELAGIGVAGRGYGARGLDSVATSAIVNHYAPTLIDPKVQKLIEGYIYPLNGHDFTSITATSRIDNQHTCEMPQKAGFTITEENEKWGQQRYVFSATVAELDKRITVDPALFI